MLKTNTYSCARYFSNIISFKEIQSKFVKEACSKEEEIGSLKVEQVSRSEEEPGIWGFGNQHRN